MFEQPFGILLGASGSSLNNRLVVDGGTLRAPNPGSGVMEVRRGTNVLNAGLIGVDNLLLTNAAGWFEFNGGTLSVVTSTVSNGRVFRVGDGLSSRRPRPFAGMAPIPSAAGCPFPPTPP